MAHGGYPMVMKVAIMGAWNTGPPQQWCYQRKAKQSNDQQVEERGIAEAARAKFLDDGHREITPVQLFTTKKMAIQEDDIRKNDPRFGGIAKMMGSAKDENRWRQKDSPSLNAYK
jgi:hypothetical protein